MNNNATILLVDDIKEITHLLTIILRKEGYKTLTAQNGYTGVKCVRDKSPDAVIMDIKMPEMDGIETMKQMKEIDPTIPILIMTAFGNIQSSVQAVKLGAYDYIVKPFDNENILITLKNALNELNLKRELITLNSKLNDSSTLTELMGKSNEVEGIVSQVKCVSPTDYSVIIYGETGSGKELVARGIHNQSSRREGQFIEVDCGAIPETLIESELFGYEKGAFTGAEEKKEGYFELASDGTLFLDEIVNLPKNMQSKLLRALEGHRIRRLGGKKDIQVDIRVIAACNERVEALVKKGRFREDLYHRLNEFSIEIPPLRKRKKDILYLARRFMDITNLELNKNIRGFSDQALECLVNYDWPGNVRELRNVVRRAMLMADDDIIKPANLAIKNSSSNAALPDQQTSQSYEEKEFSLKKIVKGAVNAIERRVIKDVLKRTGGNKSKASKILQIDYKTIRQKIKEYELETDNMQMTFDNLQMSNYSPHPPNNSSGRKLAPVRTGKIHKLTT